MTNMTETYHRRHHSGSDRSELLLERPVGPKTGCLVWFVYAAALSTVILSAGLAIRTASHLIGLDRAGGGRLSYSTVVGDPPDLALRRRREAVPDELEQSRQQTEDTIVRLMGEEPACREDCQRLRERLAALSSSVDLTVERLASLKAEVDRLADVCRGNGTAIDEEDSREVELRIGHHLRPGNELEEGRARDDVIVDHDLAATAIDQVRYLPNGGHPWPPAPEGTWRGHIPPTGPDGTVAERQYGSTGASAAGETVHTSQQLSVGLPNKLEKVCTMVPGPPGSSGYLCHPVTDLVNQQKSPKGNFYLQVVNSKSRQTHVPTAISTPNPYSFPTLSGSPVIVPASAAAPGQLAPVYNPHDGTIRFQNYPQPPQQPQYQSQQPQYQPQQTQYQPHQPQYQPQQPQYQPQQPQYQPQYQPQQPQYQIQQPQYTGQQPYPAQVQYIYPGQPQPQLVYPPPQFVQPGYPPQPQYYQPQPTYQQQPQQFAQQPVQYQPIAQQQIPSQPISTQPVPVQPIPPQAYIPQPANQQSPEMLQCSYVIVPNNPVQTYKFPTLPGVSETIQSKSEENQKGSGDRIQPLPKNLNALSVLANHTLNKTGLMDEKSNRKDMDESNCLPGTKSCYDGTKCISPEDWCDSVIDCPDKSDEKYCSCKERILPERYCDGYFDCPQGEDELGCSGCPENTFSCDDSNELLTEAKCIPLERRCDFIPDCKNGKDELECNLITDVQHVDKVSIVSYAEGFLFRNWKGTWYPVCSATTWVLDACNSEVGPLTGVPQIKFDVMPEYAGTVISESENFAKLTSKCLRNKPGTALWVTCPLPACGVKPKLDRLIRKRRDVSSPLSWLSLSKSLKKRSPQIPEPTFRTTPEALEFVKNFFNSVSGLDRKSFYKGFWGALVDPYMGVREQSAQDQQKSEHDSQYYDPTQSSWQEYLHPHYGYPTKSYAPEAYENNYNYPFDDLNQHNMFPYGQYSQESYPNYSDEYMQAYPSTIQEVYTTKDAKDDRKKRQEVLRVVGGSSSRPGAWPWLVVLYKDGNFHCGGTILRPDVVLTAAHCVEGFGDHFYEVHAGLLRRSSYSPQKQIRVVEQVVVHEDYSSKTMLNDVALMKVSRPFKFNRWVLPACLPPTEGAGEYPEPLPGTMCTAVGWGAVFEHGPDPDDLREVQVPILPECTHKIDELGNEICAGYPEGGMDTCQGDSGGPLLCQSSANKWYVAGIVSHGKGCARLGEPGVYTRVSLFKKWIENNLVFPIEISKSSKMSCPGIVCASGHCLPKSSRCNKHIDCLDGEDEIDCEDSEILSAARTAEGNLTSESDQSEKNTPPQESSSFKNESKTPEQVEISIKESNTNQSESGSVGRSAVSAENLEATNSPKVEPQTSSQSTTVGQESSSMQQGQKSEGLPATTIKDSFNNQEAISTPDAINSNPISSSTVKSTTASQESIKRSDDGYEEYLTVENPSVTNTNLTLINSSSINQPRENVIPTIENNETTTSVPIVQETILHSQQLRSVDVKNLFSCSNLNQRIIESRVCDNIIDCEDGSDEKNCSCKNHLARLSPKLICDGTVDCLDKTDEIDCPERCSSGNFFCKKSGICVPKSVRCDLKKDCYFNEDEEDCYVLAGTELAKSNENVPFRLSGMAAVFHNETWKFLCSDSNPEALAAKMCEQLGFSVLVKYMEINNSKTSLDKSSCIRLNVTCSSPTKYLWMAPIFNSGVPQTIGVLLSENWILAPTVGLQFQDSKVYLNTWLGKRNLTLNVQGVYDQYIRINGLNTIGDGAVTLLHLEEPVKVSRKVVPLGFPNWPTPPDENEECEAVGMTPSGSLFSIPLKPHICKKGSRCYEQESEQPLCSITGIVVCHSIHGYYIASVISGDVCKSDLIELPDLTINNLQNYTESGEYEELEEEFCTVRCETGKCLDMSQVGDGISDCFDSRDETEESLEEKEKRCKVLGDTCGCRPGEMRCPGEPCMPATRFCDGTVDCNNGIDEQGCDCRHYLQLAHPEQLCNGIQNCKDKSDEDWWFCKNRTDCSSSDMFKCHTSPDYRCIPNSFVCDGDADCPNSEDEESCLAMRSPPKKEKEGLLYARLMGELVPHCFDQVSNLTERICQLQSGSGVKAAQLSRVPFTSVVTDIYSRLRLNDQTSISLRSNRKFAHVRQEPHRNCSALYIECF